MTLCILKNFVNNHEVFIENYVVSTMFKLPNDLALIFKMHHWVIDTKL